ncbi:MAG: DUF5615 family PIN-like protein [Deltaproteobacteria bacterium]|nr:DUF5615 family PIN-like protein [Deltaproteobacteria bacterium]
MRLLANENVPGLAVQALRSRGHDVFWVRTDGPGISDREALERAIADHRLLITFDKDFGELAFRARVPAQNGIVLFRIPTRSPEYVVEVAVGALEADVEWVGKFSVVEENRIRSVPLPEAGWRSHSSAAPPRPVGSLRIRSARLTSPGRRGSSTGFGWATTPQARPQARHFILVGTRKTD